MRDADPISDASEAPDASATRARARRGLLWFGLGVALASAPIEVALLRSGEPFEAHPGLLFALIMVPGAVSLLVRLARREGFDDIALRVRGPHGRLALVLAWLLPVAMLALAYAASWATGLERFESPPGVPTTMGPVAAFGTTIVFTLVQATVFAAPGAAGEELGWRGYLLTRLVDADVRRPALASALAWGLWQLPLVLSGHYATGPYPALAALLFFASLVVQSYALAKLRLSSGSIWPAIFFRASWAAQLQGTFEAFTQGGLTPPRPSLWTGEAGLLVLAATTALTLAYVARPWPVRRSPAERPRRWMGLGDA